MILVCPECGATTECFDNIEVTDIYNDAHTTILGISFDCCECEKSFTFSMNYHPNTKPCVVETEDENDYTDEWYDDEDEGFDDEMDGYGY